MWRQQSYREDRAEGGLFLVPTPIGNLEDMTYRAVHVLQTADVIAAEDTRQTKKLCRHFDIVTPLVSYHEFNKEKSGEQLLTRMAEGQTVALVSDAGMPAVSDPGYELVRICYERQLFVTALPGANAALPAAVASGLNTQHLCFYGFLPRDKKEKRKALERLSSMEATLIFYEAPHRLQETISLMAGQWGNRDAAIARELTKVFEEWLRGGLRELAENYQEQKPKGEFCIVVAGASSQGGPDAAPWWADLSVWQHVNYYVWIREKTKKEAIKDVAGERNQPKREIYNTYHQAVEE